MSYNPQRERRYYKQPHARAQRRLSARLRYYTLRAWVCTVLGNQCVLCGCVEPMLLTVDHIAGGGRKHHRACYDQNSFYRELLQDGRLEHKYRLLCIACNWLAYRFNDHTVKRMMRKAYR